jgi:hypothetical protein
VHSCTVIKGYRFSRPWPAIIKLFPPRESLVSDIHAGWGWENHSPFLQCKGKDIWMHASAARWCKRKKPLIKHTKVHATDKFREKKSKDILLNQAEI